MPPSVKTNARNTSSHPKRFAANAPLLDKFTNANLLSIVTKNRGAASVATDAMTQSPDFIRIGCKNGPLTIGEDLMSFEIGETVVVRNLRADS